MSAPVERSHAECAAFLKRFVGAQGVAVDVSETPADPPTPYSREPWICPHLVAFWIEPTAEQIARWARDGVL